LINKDHKQEKGGTICAKLKVTVTAVDQNDDGNGWLLAKVKKT
jgi:hypothetical protein